MVLSCGLDTYALGRCDVVMSGSGILVLSCVKCMVCTVVCSATIVDNVDSGISIGTTSRVSDLDIVAGFRRS